MGSKPRHRCVICSTGNYTVIYKRIKRKRNQRRYVYYCKECEEVVIKSCLPFWMPPSQSRMYMEKKYGYEIQTKEEIMSTMQTLETGMV